MAASPGADRAEVSLAQDRETGSEVVSHVLVQVLVLVVVLALLQLAFALHTRNLAISSAGEGARRAALAGGGAAEGVARTGELLDASLGPSRPRSITVRTVDHLGVRTVEVTVRTALPVLLTWGPADWLTVRGRSAAEIPGG